MGRGESQSTSSGAGRRQPIAIEPPTPEAKRLWLKLADLAKEFGADERWCLVGGLMVQLHAYEHGSESRPTTDIDVLGDARRRMTERIGDVLDRLGAKLSIPPATSPTLGYQFDVDGETVEVLGPDGLRDTPRTIGTFETIMIDGGTQALNRTEKVLISIDGGEPVTVRRPTLLGAILLKARALAKVRKKLDEHREDLIRLLSFVDNPRSLAETEDLKKSERRWLRAVGKDLDFEDPVLLELFSADALERARLAYNLLTG